MAKYIIKDADVSINGVDLSERVASVTVVMDADDVDVSTMGTGVHQHLGGLRNDRFEITFLQDFAASMVDATLSPLLTTATTQTEFTIIVKPTSSAVSSTNPSFTSTKSILLTYQPIAGNVGDRSEATVTFPSNEIIARATAP